MSRKTPDNCPCGSDKPYGMCCGRFLSRQLVPDSALDVMRSRYCAYVQGDADWLRATWAAETCPDLSDVTAGAIRWLGLRIVAFTPVDATHARVEFIARGKIGSQGAFRLHERSNFEKRSGRWLYVDGTVFE